MVSAMQSPAWFSSLITQESQQQTIQVENANISYRTWGNKNRQTVLFIHGHAAHSHWWDFIAPFFSDEYDVAAIDLSGNGDSDHRSQYTAVNFAREILAVADKLGDNTIIVGHSFGGMMTRIAAFLRLSDRKFSQKGHLGGIILVDSVIPLEKNRRKALPIPKAKSRYYPDIETGMLRFRLKPPQKCQHKFLIDHIAKHSLAFGTQGYSFKLDHALFAKMVDDPRFDLPSGIDMIKDLTVPVGFIYGKKSIFFQGEQEKLLQSMIKPQYLVSIPDAAHHVFLDQPRLFCRELKCLLERILSN